MHVGQLQQRDIFWPVGASLWRVASFKSSLGPERPFLCPRGGGSVRRIVKSEIYVHEIHHIVSKQGLIGFKSGPAPLFVGLPLWIRGA